MAVAVQQPLKEQNASVYLPCVLSNTAQNPVQWQYTKPKQLNDGTDSKSVPASKIKGQCAGNESSNTLILAHRSWSSIHTGLETGGGGEGDLTKSHHKAQPPQGVITPFDCSGQIISPSLFTDKNPLDLPQKGSNYLSATTFQW